MRQGTVDRDRHGDPPRPTVASGCATGVAHVPESANAPAARDASGPAARESVSTSCRRRPVEGCAGSCSGMIHGLDRVDSDRPTPRGSTSRCAPSSYSQRRQPQCRSRLRPSNPRSEARSRSMAAIAAAAASPTRATDSRWTSRAPAPSARASTCRWTGSDSTSCSSRAGDEDRRRRRDGRREFQDVGHLLPRRRHQLLPGPGRQRPLRGRRDRATLFSPGPDGYSSEVRASMNIGFGYQWPLADACRCASRCAAT